MIFQQLQDPVSSTFTYVLARRTGAEALIIDPVFEQVDRYVALLDRLELRLVKAIDTHIHADHITGLGALRDLTRCVTVMGERSGAEVVSMRLREDEVVDVDGVKLRTLYTPGHTDDSYSFVMSDRVFTGDALLIGGTGRTDFQNGDPFQAYDSLFNKLLALPEDLIVFPAHDYRGNTASTLAWEAMHNPRLQVSSAEEYAEIMNSLNLADPKMMDVAVPANRAVGCDLSRYLQEGEEVEAEALMRELEEGGTVLVDLREAGERARDGVIPGSLHVPYGDVDTTLCSGDRLRRLQTEGKRVVLYCAFGERSALALDTLRRTGSSGLRHLTGGLGAWLRAGGGVESDATPSPLE
ncbi:MAG TPA: MBL fold metallo-hydrolase [Thermoanaerobaculia bacterium]|nr:MBL fold metallo-hydrolase [Thermoanaerobaculia bacterium]